MFSYVLLSLSRQFWFSSCLPVYIRYLRARFYWVNAHHESIYWKAQSEMDSAIASTVMQFPIWLLDYSKCSSRAALCLMTTLTMEHKFGIGFVDFVQKSEEVFWRLNFKQHENRTEPPFLTIGIFNGESNRKSAETQMHCTKRIRHKSTIKSTEKCYEIQSKSIRFHCLLYRSSIFNRCYSPHSLRLVYLLSIFYPF